MPTPLAAATSRAAAHPPAGVGSKTKHNTTQQETPGRRADQSLIGRRHRFPLVLHWKLVLMTSRIRFPLKPCASTFHPPCSIWSPSPRWPSSIHHHRCLWTERDCAPRISSRTQPRSRFSILSQSLDSLAILLATSKALQLGENLNTSTKHPQFGSREQMHFGALAWFDKKGRSNGQIRFFTVPTQRSARCFIGISALLYSLDTTV